jgi:hypothetical protein
MELEHLPNGGALQRMEGGAAQLSALPLTATEQRTVLLDLFLRKGPNIVNHEICPYFCEAG